MTTRSDMTMLLGAIISLVLFFFIIYSHGSNFENSKVDMIFVANANQSDINEAIKSFLSQNSYTTITSTDNLGSLSDSLEEMNEISHATQMKNKPISLIILPHNNLVKV